MENEKSAISQIQDIRDQHTQELVVGLCGPIGTDLNKVANFFKDTLNKDFGYECYIIKMSDYIKELKPGFDYKQLREDDPANYFNKLIDFGNELRGTHGNSVLVELAIAKEIRAKRQSNDSNQPLKRCFIIDSIKNTNELELLRLVYRELFYFVGVFSIEEDRKRALKDQGISDTNIKELMGRDSDELPPNGQKVTKVFTEADFFLRLDNTANSMLEPRIKRFCKLIFNSDVITPTKNETAMYMATSSSSNSACLSRQVGASIMDSHGEIISVGWNEVPKYGGGVYQFDEFNSSNDHRCIHKQGGVCFNDKEKEFIARTLVDELISSKLVDPTERSKALETVRNSKIKDLIEFSRAVHAEMLAIINVKVKSHLKDAILFCTTYPCHNCARHIVVAGIREVYYIEPYKKSHAIDLHEDSITEDEHKQGRVRIIMFDGVAPRRYLELFKMIPNSRKHNGRKREISSSSTPPKTTLSLEAIPALEDKIFDSLKNKRLL